MRIFSKILKSEFHAIVHELYKKEIALSKLIFIK